MTGDPAGYYAALEVTPDAAPAAVTAAFRRKARVLHPDIPGSGDAEAFMRLKAAYDVVGNARRRAAYDRAANDRPSDGPYDRPFEHPSGAAAQTPAQTPAQTMDEPAPRGPRLSDVPWVVLAGLAGVFCLAAVMSVVQFGRTPPPAGPVIRPFAPPAATVRPQVQKAVPAGGTATHYVLPGNGDTTLWRRDAARDADAYLPAGHIAPFTGVQALRLVPQRGLVEIALADGGSGFIDAVRLSPGDIRSAWRAYCAFNAGPPPRNGDVLGRNGAGGTGRIAIANRATQPAVVRLRLPSGRAAATVFVGPGDATVVGNLPDGAYRPDFALGELWSRACNGFAAGMRAQRFVGFTPLARLSPLVIPPTGSVTDISDAAFGND